MVRDNVHSECMRIMQNDPSRRELTVQVERSPQNLFHDMLRDGRFFTVDHSDLRGNCIDRVLLNSRLAVNDGELGTKDDMTSGKLIDD